MRPLVLLPAMALLASCAGAAREGINAPMHEVAGRQVGWEERKAADGDPLFVIRSGEPMRYAPLIQAAEQHAAQRCPYGYRVMSVGGADQPQIDILNPRLIIGAELRFEVLCFERDNF